MKIYECTNINIFNKLYRAGFTPFNTRCDSNGTTWLFEYNPLMRAIVEE